MSHAFFKTILLHLYCKCALFMERVTSLRRLVPLALLWLHCRPAGNARQSTGLSDSIVRASFTRKRKAQPFGWTFLWSG